MNNIRYIFGTNLRLKRIAQDLTQEQLAEKLGIEPKTISRIERGEFGTEFSTIEKLCGVFNIEPYELFLPLEETKSGSSAQELLIDTEKIYFAELQNNAENRGISTTIVKKVTRNQDAINRFDRNRNTTKDQLAPLRVEALAQSYQILLEKYPDVDPGTIWDNLQRVHYQLVAGVALPSKIVDLVTSVRQSWVKTSGTAFERFIVQRMANLFPGVQVLKPKDFKLLKLQRHLINAEKIGRTEDDDLFVLYEAEAETYLIGVIQAKTSVRERIREDSAHSQKMVEAGLWSAHITIDPDNFLGKRKFRELANGLGELGHVWHGVYKLSSVVEESEGVFDFSKLGTHLPQVVTTVINGEMKAGWRPS